MLRPYQNAFVTNIRQLLAQDKAIIACMATGGGKTKVFLSITNNALRKGTTVLILTEASKIFRQIAHEQPAAQHISARQKFVYIQPGGLYISMAQTLINRPGIISQLVSLSSRLLVITDEAHVVTTAPLIRQLPDAYHIGFTATPYYPAGKHLPELYKGIVVGPQPQELVEAGYLAPYYHYEKKSADLGGLKKGKDGDFTEKSNEWTFDRPIVYKGFEEDISGIPYRKALVFCASIRHSNHVAASLRAAGHMVSVVHTGNKEATFELASFTHGNTNICVTVGQLTKGWDFPQVTDVFLLRACGSLPLYLQMLGRGSRTYPGKEKFTVWDYGENATRLGLWNEDRDWATLWLPTKNGKKKEGIPPAKECPGCYLMVSAQTKNCPECGHVFPRTEQEEQEGAMQDALQEYNSIRGRTLSSLSPPELATYARTTNKRNFAARIARTLDAAAPGYLVQYGHIMGYNTGWEKHQSGQGVGFADVPIR